MLRKDLLEKALKYTKGNFEAYKELGRILDEFIVKYKNEFKANSAATEAVSEKTKEA